MAVLVNPPCVIFEDDHLLVVNKPPGWNTHSPAPYAGEGIYEWLKNREPRWARLAIIHRLDKETSGVLVFSKTPEGNRSLTQQFDARKVRKEYVLHALRPPPQPKLVIRSKLKRDGDRYVSAATGVEAETEFEVIGESARSKVILARPKTGRTHQIRVHAADNGFPIDGDKLYGGAPNHRLCLHARRLEFAHPTSGEILTFEAAQNFDQPPWAALRAAIISEDETDAYRHLHGAGDGYPELFVDRLGEYALAQSPKTLSGSQWQMIADFCDRRGFYEKITTP
ncbi:MAG TPA: pseudouridine synthase, partial [Verrucomicrobiae bacterium]|nr:pseudouridine synthase [Verrucomicrobiae bacterium]